MELLALTPVYKPQHMLRCSECQCSDGKVWVQGVCRDGCVLRGGGSVLSAPVAARAPSSQLSPHSIPSNQRRASAECCREGRRKIRKQQIGLYKGRVGSRLTRRLILVFRFLFFSHCGFSLHCFLLRFFNFTFSHCKFFITFFTLIKIRIVF